MMYSAFIGLEKEDVYLGSYFTPDEARATCRVYMAIHGLESGVNCRSFVQENIIDFGEISHSVEFI